MNLSSSPLTLVSKTSDCSIYELHQGSEKIKKYIFSTPHTRSIVNDTSVYGIEYTQKLQKGIEAFLSGYQDLCRFDVYERKANVLSFLRGGLNFGIREALGEAWGWNIHSSTFLSSQRYVDEHGRWAVREDSYSKVTVGRNGGLFCGDVVATGVTLDHGLERLTQLVKERKGSIRSMTFFTIGCHKAEKVLEKYVELWEKMFADFQGIDLVYIEGKFHLADSKTPTSIKLLGTDLLRRDGILAPEFIESQYESIVYPLERCTIYDAGSRAFYISEYLEDVQEYWEEVLELAQEKGMTTEKYLQERFPDLDFERYNSTVSLEEIARERIKGGMVLKG